MEKKGEGDFSKGQYHKRFEARCPLSSFVTHPADVIRKNALIFLLTYDFKSPPLGFMEIIWMFLVESEHKNELFALLDIFIWST